MRCSASVSTSSLSAAGAKARCDRSPRRPGAGPAARSISACRQMCCCRCGEASRTSSTSPRQKRLLRRHPSGGSVTRTPARVWHEDGVAGTNARRRSMPADEHTAVGDGGDIELESVSGCRRARSKRPPPEHSTAAGSHGYREPCACASPRPRPPGSCCCGRPASNPATMAPDVDEEAVIAGVEAAEGRAPRRPTSTCCCSPGAKRRMSPRALAEGSRIRRDRDRRRLDVRDRRRRSSASPTPPRTRPRRWRAMRGRTGIAPLRARA